MDLEEILLKSITLQRSKSLRVSRKLIQSKARIYAEEKAASKGQMNDFRTSEGWLEKVYVTKRVVALPSHDPGAKTLEQIIHKVISYILYVRQLKQRNNYDLDCIIAIDETAVWHEMISNATVTDKGAKSVVLKTTGHEKSKVTVTLAAKGNGDKLKPYIVFPGHKPEVQNLIKDPAIKNRCHVESTINGWVNEDTTIDWVENVLKIFNFGKRRLFARDSFRAHLVQSVKELLNKGKIDPVLIPGGTTGHIQVTDVS